MGVGRFWFDQARKLVSAALGPDEQSVKIARRVLAIIAPQREEVPMQAEWSL